MNKDIHCLKKWDEVIIFNNEIFYTPPDRFKSKEALRPYRMKNLSGSDQHPVRFFLLTGINQDLTGGKDLSGFNKKYNKNK